MCFSLHLLTSPSRILLRQLYYSLCPQSYKLGSAHSLKPVLIPELEKGIDIIKDWVINALYCLNPMFHHSELRRDFLASFHRLVILCRIFDFPETQYHLFRIPCIRIYRPQGLLREPTRDYVVHFMLQCIQDLSNDSTARGIVFLK